MALPAIHSTVNLAAMLAVLCLGLTTNSLSAVIWLAKLKGKSGAFFLGCLCVVDAMFCLTMGVGTAIGLASSNHTCTSGIVFLFSAFCANISRLLTVAVVAQRAVAVCNPLSVAALCTTRRQVAILAMLAILPMAYTAFEGYAFRLYHVSCEAGFDSQRPEYQQYATLQKGSFISYLMWHAVFAAVAISLNGVLLFAVCTITEVSDNCRLTADSRSWHQQLQRRLTAMVLRISTFSLLDITMLICRNLQGSGYVDLGMDHHSLYKLNFAYFWIYILNSSVNFLFYSCLGRDFRAALCELCREGMGTACGLCGWVTETGATRRKSNDGSSQTKSTNV